MDYTLLVAGLKGAMFLEALPRQFWPSRIYYYKVLGEHDSAFQRLAIAAGNGAQLVNPKEFDIPGDGGLVVAIGWQYLIRNSENLVVMHDSLLPRFRGFAPTVTALIRGESLLGVTALLATAEMDSGPTLAQHSVRIDQFITIERAFEAVAKCYVDCLREVLGMGTDFRLMAKNQDSSMATYSIWRDGEDFHIHWGSSAEDVIRLINAVGYPYHGARTYLSDRELVVRRAELANNVIFENRQPGKLWQLHDSYSADVVCGSGVARIWANWGDGDPAGVFSKLRLRLG